MSVLVFVYGTLKRGLPNHYLIENESDGLCSPRGRAITVDKFPLVVASRYNIPFMLYAPGKGRNVGGELYEVDEKRLRILDELEASPHLYERRDIIVTKTAVTESRENMMKAQSYFLVKYRPSLLHLPLLASYDGKGFVSPAKREEPNWWSDVHTQYKSMEKNV